MTSSTIRVSEKTTDSFYALSNPSISNLEMRVHSLMKDIPCNSFKTISQEQLWKLLFMERDRLADGKYAYEKEEPGYLNGMLAGYLFMLETLHHPLTPELYEQLHDAAIRGVSSREEPSGIPEGFAKYSDGKEAFQLHWGSTVSADGVRELSERYKSYRYQDSQNYDTHEFLKEALDPPKKTIDLTGRNPSFIRLKPRRPETCRANVAACIQVYEARPKITQKQKLSAIARLCQDLDQLHVFVDGNIRTTGILLANRLLLQQGLSPCVMQDVNQLDCLSEAELVIRLQEGQDFFQTLIHPDDRATAADILLNTFPQNSSRV